ncbi:MAG TPA: tRNA (N(6)-L-threonylcarbamoyladenosine(37)-C(2))-methylthiotransferase MtaB [Thermotogota bacterium]|nr:tRNA (N(6)-L-threonylcarbamoyladenosine(37)-C(2))-methylthiotransferase MtaB [Thermotogota bacterium]HPR96476.1 tRNA (N(6)-L-threonylcarbamoyladenosine(37)-C(2))-methylthiotransferase MtaB [Thermotogota bacterium]
MSKRTCSFITLGCKVNQYETDFMAQSFMEKGFEVIPLSPESDYVIINSCTVTNEADRKSRQMFRKARRIAETAVIIATGCSIQVAEDKLLSDEIFDFYIGNGEKEHIAEIIDLIDGERYESSREKAYWLSHEQLGMKLKNAGKKTRQYIMVQEGCSNCCTYCKIFHARGTKSVSKPVESVVDEIRHLNQNGTEEFVITGINLGEYNDNGRDFYELLLELSKMPEKVRIRISSLNPEDITPRICEVLNSEKFCPHLHISIQSGSDKVLKDMNRKYTHDVILEAVRKLRERDRLFSVSCDIIVGFPGEQDEDFKQTVDLLKAIKPLKTHIFRYSPKKGTPASRFTEQIDGNEKRFRAKKLEEISDEISKEVRNRHIGEKREIIIENTENGRLTGHDEYYLKHNCDSTLLLSEGKKIRVTVTGINENSEQDEVNSEIENIY